jgi:hypothetical protein
VKDLQYDLYAAVAAAKRGISCVLDFNSNGHNQSYLLCKQSGQITPLIERRKGILEVPIHLYVPDEQGLMVTDSKSSRNSSQMSMASISKFWTGMDMRQFDPYNRDNNNDEISLFTFDIIKSLGQKQKDFLKWRLSPEAEKYYTQKENQDFYTALKKGDLKIVDAIRKEKQQRIDEYKRRFLICYLSLFKVKIAFLKDDLRSRL